MCLGIVGQVVGLDVDHADLARVDVHGEVRTVNVGMVDGVTVGDWIVIHLGFALERTTADEARASLELLSELADGGDVDDRGPAL